MRLRSGALSGHDGLIRVATLLTFQAGQRLACRRHPCTGCLRTPDDSLPCFPNLPCFRAVASGNRLLLAALLALIVIVEECALGADDLRALVTVDLVTVLADERANARRLLLDGIERIDGHGLDVEPGAGCSC